MATNGINAVEFAQLKQMITEKHAELKTAEQKRAEELARMSFLEKFKVENELKEDEEWRGDNIYCKKCNTPRSHYWEEYQKAVRIKCQCQQKQADEEKRARENSDCKRKQFAKIERFRNKPNKYGFDKFKVSYDWQRQMVVKVKDFLKDIKKSIIFTGQSGSGKTHIFNSAVLS